MAIKKKFVITNIKTGQFVCCLNRGSWVSSVSSASKFQSLQAAKNYMAENFLYAFSETPVEETKILLIGKAQGAEAKLYIENSEAESDLQDYVAYVEQSCEAFRKFSGLKEYYCKLLSQVDKEQQDILHAIEFSNANAAEGYRLYKQLHDIRVRRRTIKDNLALATTLSQTGVLASVEKLSSLINTLEQQKETRVYAPRVLHELFEQAS